MVDDGDTFHDFFPYLVRRLCLKYRAAVDPNKASRLTGNLPLSHCPRIDAKMRKLVLVGIYAPVEQLESSKERKRGRPICLPELPICPSQYLSSDLPSESSESSDFGISDE